MASTRILLIEDEGPIAEMYRLKLASQGWHVEVACDGESGLQRALEEPPDLILLDIMLPRLEGLEVLRGLRAGERTRRIPVLVVSNSVGSAGREREARRLGIVDWIVKARTTPTGIAARVAEILPA